MKNEAQFKTAFKKSVRAQGGFSLSLAAPMISGIPDLYVIMPGYCPLLLEAKWLGEAPDPFNRKIKYTKLQQHFLKECCSVKDYTAMGLIGFKQKNKYWCTILHPTFTQINSLCADNYYVCIDKSNSLFDVHQLFSYYPIPRINGAHIDAARVAVSGDAP